MKLIKLGSGSFYIIALTTMISLVAGNSPAIAQEPIENTASASGDNLPQVGSNLNRVVTSNTITTPVDTTQTAQLELIKTADRAAAEPGDTVVYRLSLRNNGTTAVTGFTITDTLPIGINFLSESIQGSITDGTNTTPITPPTITRSGRIVTFSSSDTLNPGQILNVVYAAVVTPDAVRGHGRNTAQEPRSNLASYRLRIRPGILSDCGTVIGRVFVDKNFDGEQQPGEPGVPNAVVIMDDGNRITADANGIFSMANVISGNRTGTLDLSSLPGYTLAPNLYFIERNSQSRLVRLEPGGLVRMNFAVTPASGEQQ